MIPGCAGADVGVTDNVVAADAPHALFATTLTLPAVVLGVADILVVVEVPVQPPGRVQV